MPIRRRNVLYLLAGAGGWPFLKGRAARGETTGKPRAEALTLGDFQASVHDEPVPVEGEPVERVLGIGGLFIRAHDPKALAAWYRSHLGVNLIPSGSGQNAWQTEAGPTAFQPFSMTSKYMGDEHQMWMVNFRVRDLDKMAAQLRTAGIEVKVDPETYPYGRFARIHDPEQNPIELWQPVVRDAAHP